MFEPSLGICQKEFLDTYDLGISGATLLDTLRIRKISPRVRLKNSLAGNTFQM